MAAFPPGAPALTGESELSQRVGAETRDVRHRNEQRPSEGIEDKKDPAREGQGGTATDAGSTEAAQATGSHEERDPSQQGKHPVEIEELVGFLPITPEPAPDQKMKSRGQKAGQRGKEDQETDRSGTLRHPPSL